MQIPESIEIVDRFFAALYRVIEDKKIRGKETFATRYGINPGNFRQLEVDHSRSMFKVGWLVFLVRDFGVSPVWLLTGEGEFYAALPGKKKAAEP